MATQAKNNHRPVLIVIAGPNGSGKTTITGRILKHEWLENAIYINPDQIAKDMFGDWNDREAILQAAQYCEVLREQCLSDKQSLIFETVLSAPDKIDFIKRAINNGFFVRLFFVSTESPSINASRVARRVMNGGHDVPITKIISRYQRSIVNCRLLCDLVDRAYLYDNSIDNQEATLVCRFVNGTLHKQYVQELPRWVASMHIK